MATAEPMEGLGGACRPVERLRLGQINLHHSRAATLETAVFMQSHRLDVLLTQEPYVVGDKVVGFADGCAAVHTRRTRPLSAVLVSPGVDVFWMSDLTDEHFVTVRVTRGTLDVVLVSGYFQPAKDVNEMLAKLGRILDSLRGARVLVALDANSKSTLWGSPFTDPRGASLMQFLEARNLYCVNDGEQPPTFSSELGESYIDVTLVTGNILADTGSWNVWPEASISDHRLITYDITHEFCEEEALVMPRRYSLRNADLDRLRAECGRRMDNLVWSMDSRESVEAMAKDFSQAVMAGCSAILLRPSFRAGQPEDVHVVRRPADQPVVANQPVPEPSWPP